MSCCKIGCKNVPIKEQEIAFKNRQGCLIRTNVQWCKDHGPENIFEEFAPEDLLRDGGY